MCNAALQSKLLRVCSLTTVAVPYSASLKLQELLVSARKAGHIPDTLLLCQHLPVYTIGKRGSLADVLVDVQHLKQLGAEVHTIPRGGEATFHGPGQLVAYPIADLRSLKIGARAYVEGLEDAMVATCGCYGLQARGRVPRKTGVWIGDRKVGAVGVRITHGISSHGVALNVNTDLSWYSHIIPCGTPDKEVTSIAKELGRSRPSTVGEPEPQAAGEGGIRLAASSSRSDGSSSRDEVRRNNGSSGISALGFEKVGDSPARRSGMVGPTASYGGQGNERGQAAAASRPSTAGSVYGRPCQQLERAGGTAEGVPEVSYDVVEGQMVDALVRQFGWTWCQDIELQQLVAEVWPHLQQQQGAGDEEWMETLHEGKPMA